MAEWNDDFPGHYFQADTDLLGSFTNFMIPDWITGDAEDLFMEDYNDSDLAPILDAFPYSTETARTEQNLGTLDLPDLCSPPQIQPHLWKPHDETMMDDFGMIPFVFEPEPVIGNTTIQPQLLRLTNEAQQGLEPPGPPHNMTRIDPTHTTMLLESERGTNGRRRQPRIAAEARNTLLDFYKHTPYPTAENFEILALQTNLEVRKVRNWFSNCRSRQGRVDEDPAGSSISSECPAAVFSYLQPSQTRLSKESLESVASHYSRYQKPPMEAWISSSFESDPVAVANIEAAVAKAKTASIHSVPPYEKTHSHSEVYEANSVQASSSIDSNNTVSSRGSRISATSRTSRRGRRRVTPYPLGQNQRAAIQDKYDKERPYTCTFRCGQKFKWKYDWVRHEEAVHFPRAIWICCANEIPSFGNCPYCSAESPDRSHIEGHGFSACKARSLEQRTFYRRDNFVEHIHKVHGNGEKHPNAGLGCSKNSGYGCSDLADKWKQQAPPISPDDPMLNCGFCGERLSTWEKRRDHVSNHFSLEKRCISSWWSERKSAVLQRLTSAVSKSYEGPYVCRYCHNFFLDGPASHSHCYVWSCRFLEIAHPLTPENATGNVMFPTKSYLEYSRGCTQELFTSRDAFYDHLDRFHNVNFDIEFNGPEMVRQFSRCRRAEFEPAKTESVESGPAKNEAVESEPATMAAVLEEQDEENVPHYILLRLPKGVGDEFAQLPVSNGESAGPMSSKHKHRLSTLFRKVLQRYRTDSSSR